MKKLLIATLIGCTALSSLNVSAKTKSFSEKDLMGTWQCEVKDENTLLTYTSNYGKNHQAYDDGKFVINMDDIVFSYDISMKYEYKVQGNQILSTGKIEKFKANHNQQAKQAITEIEFLKDFDSVMEQAIRATDGQELVTLIHTLSKNKLVVMNTENDQTPAMCKRIK